MAEISQRSLKNKSKIKNSCLSFETALRRTLMFPHSPEESDGARDRVSAMHTF